MRTKTATVGSIRAGTSCSIADVPTRKHKMLSLMTIPLGIKACCLLCYCVVVSIVDLRFKSLSFISTDYRAEVHGNIKQHAIDVVRSSKSSTEASDKSCSQVVGTGTTYSASESGPACT